MNDKNEIVQESENKVEKNYAEKVTQKTISEVRTFLDELANGTSNYDTLLLDHKSLYKRPHERYLLCGLLLIYD